jgi:acetyl-CoA acetyltransferase
MTTMRILLWVAILGGASRMSLAEEHVILSAVAQGRYLLDAYGTSFCSTGPTEFNPFSEFDIGQGQAAYASFDIAELSGNQIAEVTFSFTQTRAANPYAFPLQIVVSDVSTSYDRLIIDRNPLDAEGLDILLDLRSGNPYASSDNDPVAEYRFESSENTFFLRRKS